MAPQPWQTSQHGGRTPLSSSPTTWHLRVSLTESVATRHRWWDGFAERGRTRAGGTTRHTPPRREPARGTRKHGRRSHNTDKSRVFACCAAAVASGVNAKPDRSAETNLGAAATIGSATHSGPASIRWPRRIPKARARNPGYVPSAGRAAPSQIPLRQSGSDCLFTSTRKDPSGSSGCSQAHRTGRRNATLITISHTLPEPRKAARKALVIVDQVVSFCPQGPVIASQVENVQHVNFEHVYACAI